jgi:hypothetical protein
MPLNKVSLDFKKVILSRHLTLHLIGASHKILLYGRE